MSECVDCPYRIPLQNKEYDTANIEEVELLHECLEKCGWMTWEEILAATDNSLTYPSKEQAEADIEPLIEMGIMFRFTLNGQKFYHANPDWEAVGEGDIDPSIV